MVCKLSFKTFLVFSFSCFVFNAAAQLKAIPYESDSTFYMVERALKDPQRCAYIYLEYDSIKTLPEDFTRLNRLRGITFRYCVSVNWGQVLSMLSKMPKLEYLEISVSKINKVHQNLGQIKQLRSLNLKGNNLQVVPDQVDKLPNLSYINLSYNPGMRWDETFKRLADCNALVDVDLSSNSFTSLDENIVLLAGLKRLTLSANYLNKLPSDFDKLENLEELELSNNPGIDWKQAATPVSQLLNLRKLMITGNDLVELPNKITALKNLEELHAYANSLESLPENIGNLTNLRVLNIGSSRTGQTRNQIGEFPKSFSKLTKLEYLNMNGTYMQDLPSGLRETKALRELYVNWCGLTDLKYLENCTNLEVLEAGHNYFFKLPEWIGSLQNLRVLNLDGNFFPGKQVPHLQYLPESICRLQNLEVLRLNDQLLKSLPSCLGELKSLQVLTLRNNMLDSLPSSLSNLTSLRDLELKANMITVLPDLNKMKQLQTLNLSFNPDLNLNTEAGKFKDLNQLKKLDISYLPSTNNTMAAIKQSLPNTEIVYLTYKDLMFDPEQKKD